MNATLDLGKCRADAKLAFETADCESCRTLAAMVILLTTAVAEWNETAKLLATQLAEAQLREEERS